MMKIECKIISVRIVKENLTQKELADKLGITDKAISKWERGQGCPDVSLLELLSKELECSILELLKGCEIENKVIPVLEADDYIKDGINYSKMNLKNKIKIIANRMIVIAIVFIGLILSYLNVVQIMYIDKEYTYSTSRGVHKEVMSYIDCVEKNIKTIKNGKGAFNTEDYNEIVKNIDDYYTDINKIKLLKYIKSRENLTYTINDVRILNLSGYYLSYEMNTLDLLEKYSKNSNISSYKNLTKESFFNNGASAVEIKNKPLFAYQYRISSSEDFGENLLGLDEGDLSYIENDIEHELSKLIYLTELVMEVGEIND